MLTMTPPFVPAAAWWIWDAVGVTSLKVSAAIYWQALRLWLKRTPFHPHPSGR